MRLDKLRATFRAASTRSDLRKALLDVTGALPGASPGHRSELQGLLAQVSVLVEHDPELRAYLQALLDVLTATEAFEQRSEVARKLTKPEACTPGLTREEQRSLDYDRAEAVAALDRAQASWSWLVDCCLLLMVFLPAFWVGYLLGLWT